MNLQNESLFNTVISYVIL